uniref:Uncharacterized protein n=1 Tax=Onchocerca volvulus TaxID=6282 RepID=A0A8R1TUV6_ONCVO
MNSIHEFLRRILPNRLNLSRDDFSFELLRSASVQELKKHDSPRQQIMWPRPTSSHDNFHINAGKLALKAIYFEKGGKKVKRKEVHYQVS